MSSSIEILESRIAPAGLINITSYDPATGALELTADDGGEHDLSIYKTGANTHRIDGYNGTEIGAVGVNFKDLGKLTSITFTGGADADNLSLTNLTALTAITFNGGAGSDSVNIENVAVKGAVQLNLGADGGLVGSYGSFFTVGGDLKVNYGDGGSVFLGTLVNTIKGAVTLTGGVGIDSFFLQGDKSSVGKGITFTGNGDADVLQLSSALSLTVGKGADGRAIAFDGGAGPDRLDMFGGVTKLGGSLDFAGGEGENSVDVGGDRIEIGGDLKLSGGLDTDEFDFSPSVLKVTGGATIDLGDGNNEADLFHGSATIGKAVIVTGGDGDDEFDFGDELLSIKGSLTINLGNGVENEVTIGANSIQLAGELKINGGTGDDTVELSGHLLTVSGPATIALGDGTNELAGYAAKATYGKALTITGGANADQFFMDVGTLTVGGAFTLTAGAGTNQTGIYGTIVKFGAELTYNGGDGEDSFDAGGSSLTVAKATTINAGDGVNFVNFGGSTNTYSALTIAGGDGVDSIQLNGVKTTIGGAVTVNLGAGADSFSSYSNTLNTKAAFTISGGDDADQVRIFADGTIAGDLTIDLGAADDAYQGASLGGNSGLPGILKVGGNLTVTSTATDTGLLALSDNFDATDLTVAKNVVVSLGNIDSYVFVENLSTLGNFTLTTGGGADYVNMGDGTYFGPMTIAKVTTISLGLGDDIIQIGGDSSAGSHRFVRFLGNVTVDGGGGANTINPFDDPAENFFGPGVNVIKLGFA